MNELLCTETETVWEHIAPHLDNALGELSDADRDALLLRYFQRKSAREMAQTLGTSEDAAQKRVSRAVERMRELFAKRGVTVGASGFVVVLSANAVHAAPVGLSAAITTSATLAKATIITMKWLNAKAVAAMIAGMVIVGTGTVFVLQSKVVPSPATPTTAAPAPPAPRGPGRPFAGLVSGILKTPDGQPLPAAVVYLSTAFVPVPVYSDPSPKVQSTVTGRDGRFAFPEDPANRAVIVLNEKGYGEAT